MKKTEKIINHTENLKVPEGRSKSEIWTDLQNKMDADTAKTKKLFIKQPVFYYSIASTVVIFISVLFFLSNSTTEVFVQAGQTENVLLPDGSEVIVNSVSSLFFSTKEWESERIVNLEGEAYFKVKKGSNFTVNCANGTVEVKGTVFNVFSRENILKVKCTEGAVSVTSKSGKTGLLKKTKG